MTASLDGICIYFIGPMTKLLKVAKRPTSELQLRGFLLILDYSVSGPLKPELSCTLKCSGAAAPLAD